MKKINLSSRIFGVAQLFFCLLTPGYTLAAEDILISQYELSFPLLQVVALMWLPDF